MNVSTVNCDFDIASIFVTLALVFYTFTKYSEGTLGNRAFKRMVFCSLLYCVSSFLAAFALNKKAGMFVELSLYSLCCFFFISFSQAILAYTNAYIYTTEQAKKEKKAALNVFFPILGAALIANFFTGFLFFVDDDFSIAKGSAYVLLPATAAILSFKGALRLGRNAQKFNKAQIAALCLLYETTIALPFFQTYACPQIRISSFVFALLTTTLLFAIETPDDQALLSTIAELENLQRALKNRVEKKTSEARARRERLERLATQMMYALVETIDAKDRYTSGHSARVARYAKMLAQKKGLSAEKCQQIYTLGILHDIGKVGVSSKIINKPGRLTDQEFSQMKAHAIIGSMILENVSTMPELRAGARWHHERIDGRGYPDGLSGDQIPLEAKIISVADAYDAMTSNRSYRKPVEQSEVREQIRKGIGSQFDKEIASLMIELIDEDKEYNLHEYKSSKEDRL